MRLELVQSQCHLETQMACVRVPRQCFSSNSQDKIAKNNMLKSVWVNASYHCNLFFTVLLHLVLLIDTLFNFDTFASYTPSPPPQKKKKQEGSIFIYL